MKNIQNRNKNKLQLTQPNNSTKSDETPETMEYTFNLRQSKYESKTNRYTFEFPASWRTLTNCDLELGVRGIYLRKSERKLLISNFKVFVIFNNIRVGIGESESADSQFVIMKSTDTLEKVAEYLDSKLEDACEHYYRPIQGYVTQKASKIDSFFVYDNMIQLKNIKSLYSFIYYAHQEYSIHFSKYGASNDIKNLLCIPPDVNIIKSPFEFHCWDRKSDLLVKASFVNQPDYHLGFTNYQFSPIKYYSIKNNEQDFWIELWDPAGSSHVQLPADNKDNFVIECVLIIKKRK